MKLKSLYGMLAAAGLVAMSGAALATDGYFSHGYGTKAKGMGGAGIAFGQDALAAATNPANMVLVGDRMDVGLEYFRPDRESVTNSTHHDGNGKQNFFIPEFGYNKMLNQNMSFGVAVYGNGGMNTKYNNYNRDTAGTNYQFGTSGSPFGVDLAQLFIAPTFSMKLNNEHSFGIALNLAYQRIKVTGLQNLDGAGTSTSPGNVTDRGYDNSYGLGARIGWTGKLNEDLTVGATYQSRTYMSKFDKYKGLFAEQGDFDIPANYGFGAAFRFSPAMTVAVDITRIQYGSVKSISNNGAAGGAAYNLGANGGAGFGWQDQTVYKIGASYDVSKALTLRAGWNHGDVPYQASETSFNILAPAVVTDHATLGATWKFGDKSEVSAFYMHAFEGQLTNSATLVTNRMRQDAGGVSYGMKF